MNKRAKLFLPAAGFLALIGVLLYGLNSGRNPNAVPSALVNRPLPVFSQPALLADATAVTSEQLQGGIFLVNFWGTWCPPCHAEHPYLMEISKREGDITFVGVNYKDDVALAREFLSERGNPFKFNLVDVSGGLGIDFGVVGAPETFIVDQSGTIRYKHVGSIDHKVWDEVFVPLLAELR